MNATDPMALLGNLIFATPQWGHLAWPILAITVLLLWLRLRSPLAWPGLAGSRRRPPTRVPEELWRLD